MKNVSPNPTASPPLAYDAQLWNRQSKMCWDSCQCKLGPVRDVRILGLLTQQNPAHASHRFTETQHTNIRPHKTLSHCLSTHPLLHDTLPKLIQGERQAPCKHGSPLAAFCSHSVKVLYCLDTVIHRPKPRPVSLNRRRFKGCYDHVPIHLTFSFDPILIWVCNNSQGT